jgi:peptidyl-prolyl cis-trans isomerase D
MGIILGLIAISFGIWGIGDIFRGFGQSTVAKVGNTEIRVESFRQTYQDRLQQIGRQVGRPILPDQARALGLDRQVLAQVIADTVLDERARALRLGIADSEIARRITEDPNFKGLTGQFDRLRFEQLIRQVGYTEQRYLAEQRRTALRQQLVGTVAGEMVVPKTAVDAVNRYQNEQRTIEYILLNRALAGDVADPSPEALAKYFEERKLLFRAPEYRKAVLLVVTPTELAATIELSDADLRKAYEERKSRYVTAERRHIQQIVFPTMDEAKAAAEKIAQGTTFAALAAERDLKETDIDLGTVAQTAIVDRAVGAAAFALKAGEVSAPVEGRFGIALVHVVKIEPSQTRPFEQVADEIKADVVAERAKADLLNVHDKVEDERLSGVSLADAAKKFNFKVRTIEAIDRSGNDPNGVRAADLPQGVDVPSAVFTADIGGDNEPLRIPNNGGYVWFDVVDIKPARERPLDEIKDQVLERWRADEISAQLKTKTTEILDKLKAGTPFAEVAAANNLKAEWLPGLKRSTPPAGFSARTVDEVFRTPKGASASADGPTATDRVVFHVTEITVPQLTPDSADAKRIDDVLRRALAEDLYAQYVGRLEKDIGVTINRQALNQITGGSSAN